MTDFGSTAAGSEVTRGLMKKREEEQMEFERKKQEIKDKNAVSITMNKFANAQSMAEHELIKSTIGLVSLQEFQKTKQNLERNESMAAAAAAAAAARESEKAAETRKRKASVNTSTLSFSLDEDLDGDGDLPSAGAGAAARDSSGEDEPPLKKIKVSKNPYVQTDFLPDSAREAEEQRLVQQLKDEWLQKQEEMKKEKLEITYSYWDGQGQRRTLTVTKGTTILQFLEMVRTEFPVELRGVSAENLMYIKEDCIVPQHYSFYDLIVSKARGKSGPMYFFDVHEDVRLLHDATVEKEESHAGKVVERRWYERNKHIFPASRWEPYDPKNEYGTYTLYSLKEQ